jgi:hypothetical protein
MPAYTVEGLRKDGPPFAMAMLLKSIDHGESFVTYGDIRKELEYQLNIQRIFPTQIGEVAGSLMDKILVVDPDAPLINVLITRGSGIPGKGVGGYLAKRYRNPKLKNWDKISKQNKLQIVDQKRKKVFLYKKWDSINHQLFGRGIAGKLREKPAKETDYNSTGRGGPAESEEHKKLKAWVAADPSRIGLSKSYGAGVPEYRLMSGDEVDIMFMSRNTFRAVEVKSIRSNDDDFKRGIYQCVKYREVKTAEIKPYHSDVEAILVVERELSSELKERAAILGVKCKCVSVNKP